MSATETSIDNPIIRLTSEENTFSDKSHTPLQNNTSPVPVISKESTCLRFSVATSFIETTFDY